jgi:hypothetical protein
VGYIVLLLILGLAAKLAEILAHDAGVAYFAFSDVSFTYLCFMHIVKMDMKSYFISIFHLTQSSKFQFVSFYTVFVFVCVK